MLPGITTREHAVLELLARGLRNREIAACLNVAEGTVEQHLAHLYRKLGVHNRATAIRLYWTSLASKDVGNPNRQSRGAGFKLAAALTQRSPRLGAFGFPCPPCVDSTPFWLYCSCSH